MARCRTGPTPTGSSCGCDLDAAAIVGVLNRHGVKYVVIGGIAAQLHDLPVPATVDIDVTPARDHKNLEWLARAFDERGLSRLRLINPDEASIGALPQRCANEASLRSRSGLSPAVTSSVAAVSVPIP